MRHVFFLVLIGVSGCGEVKMPAGADADPGRVPDASARPDAFTALDECEIGVAYVSRMRLELPANALGLSTGDLAILVNNTTEDYPLAGLAIENIAVAPAGYGWHVTVTSGTEEDVIPAGGAYGRVNSHTEGLLAPYALDTWVDSTSVLQLVLDDVRDRNLTLTLDADLVIGTVTSPLSMTLEVVESPSGDPLFQAVEAVTSCISLPQ